MSRVADVDYILTECFVAAGPDKTVDFDALASDEVERDCRMNAIREGS